MKKFYDFLLGTLFILTILLGPSKGDKWSNVQNLRKKLLKDYDKNISPHGGSNGTTVIYFTLIVNEIFVLEDRQVFSVTGHVVMHWVDKRLKWDPKDFQGEKLIHFQNEEIWKPDLMINNADRGTEIDHFKKSTFSVYNNGGVIWAPPTYLSIPCTLDLKFWPYDIQKCKIVLVSGTHDGLKTHVKNYNNKSEIPLDDIQTSKHSWNILEAKQIVRYFKYDETREYFYGLNFVFTIKRNSPTFGAFVIVPAVAIPLFLMIQFILPVDHSKRLLISFVCSLLVMMELLFLKFSLPKLGTSVPLIVSYYSECFMIVILTIVLSAILGRLTHPTNPLLDFPPPESVKTILTGRLATILRVEINVGMNGKATDDVETLANNPNYSLEWISVAKVIDRISFILVLCIFLFSLLGYVAPIH